MTINRLMVMFNCNDSNGLDTGSITAIDIVLQTADHLDGLIRLEGLETPFRLAFGGVRIGDVDYVAKRYSRYSGNIHWDSAEMMVVEVARLLNNLRGMGGGVWSCMEAEAGLFAAWDNGEVEIAEEDLERAIAS